jgi:hypothetical protein
MKPQRIQFTTEEIMQLPLTKCSDCRYLKKLECELYEGFKLPYPDKPCRCINYEIAITTSKGV